MLTDEDLNLLEILLSKLYKDSDAILYTDVMGAEALIVHIREARQRRKYGQRHATKG